MSADRTFALWVTPEGVWSQAALDAGTSSYDLIKRGIGSRNWFDHVNVDAAFCRDFGHTIDFWVDDEGLLKELPVNFAAWTLDGRQLVGPIVITGGADAEGETLGLKASAVAALRALLRLDPKREQLWPTGDEEMFG